jgi:hypothetical protein
LENLLRKYNKSKMLYTLEILANPPPGFSTVYIYEGKVLGLF